MPIQMATPPAIIPLALTTRDKLPKESQNDFKNNKSLAAQPIVFSLCIRYTSSHSEVERWIAIEGNGVAASPFAPAAQPQRDPADRKNFMPPPMAAPTEADIKEAKTTAVKIFDGDVLRRKIDISKIAAIFFDNSETVTIYVTGEEDLCISMLGTPSELAKKTKPEIVKIMALKQRRFLKVLIELMDPRIPVDLVPNAKLKANALDKRKKDKGRPAIPLKELPPQQMQQLLQQQKQLQQQSKGPSPPASPKESTAPKLPEEPPKREAVPPPSPNPADGNARTSDREDRLRKQKSVTEMTHDLRQYFTNESLALQRLETERRMELMKGEKSELRQDIRGLQESLRQSVTQRELSRQSFESEKAEPILYTPPPTVTTPPVRYQQPSERPQPVAIQPPVVYQPQQTLSFDDILQRYRQVKILGEERQKQQDIQKEVERLTAVLHPPAEQFEGEEYDEEYQEVNSEFNEEYNHSEVFSNPKITYGDLFESNLYKPPLYADPENEDPYYYLIKEIPHDITNQILKPLQLNCDLRTTPGEFLAKHQEITDITTGDGNTESSGSGGEEAAAKLLGNDETKFNSNYYLGKGRSGSASTIGLSLEKRQFANKLNHGKHYLEFESMQSLLTNNNGVGLSALGSSSTSLNLARRGRPYGASVLQDFTVDGEGTVPPNSATDTTRGPSSERPENAKRNGNFISDLDERTLRLEQALGWSPTGNTRYDQATINVGESNLGKFIEYIARRERQKKADGIMYPLAHPLL